jgi:hypothetical protein
MGIGKTKGIGPVRILKGRKVSPVQQQGTVRINPAHDQSQIISMPHKIGVSQ